MSFKIEITQIGTGADGITAQKLYEQVVEEIDLRLVISAVNGARVRRPSAFLPEKGQDGSKAAEPKKGGAKV